MSTIELIESLDITLAKVYEFMSDRGIYYHKVEGLIGSDHWWNELDEDMRIRQMRLQKELSDAESNLLSNCKGYLKERELKQVATLFKRVGAKLSARDKSGVMSSSVESLIEQYKKAFDSIKPHLELVAKAEVAP